MDLQLPVQSVPITTNVVSSSPSHCEVLCDKSLSVSCDSSVVFSTNKTDRITEILLNMALNTINQPSFIYKIHVAKCTNVVTNQTIPLVECLILITGTSNLVGSLLIGRLKMLPLM